MPPLREPLPGREVLQASALLLHALAGRSLTLQALPVARPDAPPQRPVLTSTHLLLPADAAPALHRAAIAHAAAHLLHSVPGQASSALKPLAQAVAGAVEDARVEQLLAQALPGVRAWFDAPLRAALEPEGLSAKALLSRMDLALHDETYVDGNHWVNKARDLFVAARRAHGLADPAPFRRLASVLSNDLGQMRVRHEPQQFAVPAPYRDDHSYLWEHERSREEEQDLQTPLIDADAAQGETTMETAVVVYHYPEWDWRSGVLRQDWCTLHELAIAETFPQVAEAWVPAARPALKLRQCLGYGHRLRRQPEGESLDLDAAIEAEVARRLRHSHNGRVFQRMGPRQPPLGLLLLLDSSQSTGDADAQGCRLLTLEQQAAWLLAQTAQSAQGAQGRIAIHAFSSDTRARVRYQRLLDFGAPLDARAAARLQSLQPAWSTRLGAALRHATQLLAAEPVERRVLFVLSDGAPGDIDVHDSRYLVEDARSAVQEAVRAGILVYGLVVDAGAADYARRIFGLRCHRALMHAGQLQRQVTALYAHFLRQ